MSQKPVFSFRINPDLYQRLKKEIKKEEVVGFVHKAIDKELTKQKLFEQKLIADYQSVVKNKKIQKEQEIWDETLNDAWKKDE